MRTDFRLRDERTYLVALAAIFGAFVYMSSGSAYAQTVPTASTMLTAAGKRLAIRMAQSCPPDPDPLGLVNDLDDYSTCEQDELDKVRGWITAWLTTKGVFGQVGDDNPDLILTVTLTESESVAGLAGAFTDLAPTTLKFTASYQLADSTGRVVKSGTVHHEDAEDYFGGNEDAVEQQFADKIAAAVAASVGVGTPGAVGRLSSGAPVVQVGNAATPSLTPAQQEQLAVTTQGYFDIVAQAYRSLPSKPLLPDEARAEKLKAEAAAKAGNAMQEALAYDAALKIADWWPDGRRDFALALAKINKVGQAIPNMRVYLELVPDAPDAVAMQAKIAEWSRIAPPPVFPTTLPMPPGGRLGISLTNTPAIVAAATGNPNLNGVLVTFVFSGSPAEKAGLVKGDIITAFNGTAITGVPDLMSNLKSLQPGAHGTLEIIGRKMSRTVTVQF